jgi:hypothetical protein
MATFKVLEDYDFVRPTPEHVSGILLKIVADRRTGIIDQENFEELVSDLQEEVEVAREALRQASSPQERTREPRTNR